MAKTTRRAPVSKQNKAYHNGLNSVLRAAFRVASDWGITPVCYLW